MASFDLEQVRAFESQYYKEMPDYVRQAIELRNSGWQALGQGDESGAQELVDSVQLLADDYRVFGGENLTEDMFRHSQLINAAGQIEPKDSVGNYQREMGASLARLALVEASGREFGGAAMLARAAWRSFSPVQGMISEEYRRITGAGFEDQYKSIFSGRLALVLAASGNARDLDWAVNLAREARSLARISEDPSKVVFVDTKMTDEKRKAARRNHKAAARAATLSARAPLSVSRKVAQRVLAA